MSRKRLFGALALLLFGINVARNLSVPLPAARPVPSAALIEQTAQYMPPASIVVRGFDVVPQIGLDVLDERAEVMFDD